MKSEYTNEHSRCVVSVSNDLPPEMRERVREVSRVWTDRDHRKNGYATELMKSVCEDADLENIVLMLGVRSFDSSSVVGNQKLIEWYKRFGFVVTQKEPVILMARAPEFKARQSMVGAAVERLIRG